MRQTCVHPGCTSTDIVVVISRKLHNDRNKGKRRPLPMDLPLCREHYTFLEILDRRKIAQQ